jgi:hypothetical protein
MDGVLMFGKLSSGLHLFIIDLLDKELCGPGK